LPASKRDSRMGRGFVQREARPMNFGAIVFATVQHTSRQGRSVSASGPLTLIRFHRSECFVQ
jgi:hypothetical protein